MMCFHPISIGEGLDKVNVPCGKCAACLHNLTYEWYVRLKSELKYAKNAFFLTLSYDDYHLSYRKFSFNTFVHKVMDDCSIDREVKDILLYKTSVLDDNSIFIPVYETKHIQDFLKRLRYNAGQPSSFKYFGISEYGPKTLRPHYHFIFFNLFDSDDWTLDKCHKLIEKSWGKGFIEVSFLNDNRIFYTVKYSFGLLELPKFPYGLKDVKPRRFMSKGLGKCYLSDSILKWHKQGLKTYYQDGKRKLRLPRYLRDKIFSSEELEQIKERNLLFVTEHNVNYRSELENQRSEWLVKGVTTLQEKEDNFVENIKKKHSKRK